MLTLLVERNHLDEVEMCGIDGDAQWMLSLLQCRRANGLEFDQRPADGRHLQAGLK